MNLAPHLLSLVSLAILPSSVSAATVWTESVNGDLSSDAAAPTSISFALGSNVINGSVNGTTDARDYITFTVQAGQILSSIQLLMYDDLDTGPANDGNTGFNAINLGSTSFIPSAETAGNFLGGAHVEPSIGVDLLAILAGAPAAGTGFTAPLGPGTYSYLIQQTGPQMTGYSLDFVVVPEPSGCALLLAGAGLASRRSRRSR